MNIKFRLRLGIFLIPLSLSACNPFIGMYTHIGGDLHPGESGYPSSNLHPQHLIRIEVAAPATVDIQLWASYETDGRNACRSTPTLIAGMVEGATFPSSVSIPVALRSVGNEQRGTLIVDAFEPGKCDWQFSSLHVILSKGSLVSLPNLIVDVPDVLNKKYQENAYANSLATPVVLTCDFRYLERDGAGSHTNACVLPRSNRPKHVQLLSPETSVVRLEVEDVGVSNGQ